jgi:hypothetical protein
MKKLILILMLFVAVSLQAQTVHIYRLAFANDVEAIMVRDSLTTLGYEAINLTGFGAQIITQGYYTEDSTWVEPVMDNRYFAMIATDTIVSELTPYIVDLDYFKPVYAGQQNEDNVIKE